MTITPEDADHLRGLAEMAAKGHVITSADVSRGDTSERDKALEDAANIAAQYHVRLSAIGVSDPVDAPSYAANVALDIRLAILDLKDKGE
jgi:hypothetical protein